MTLARRIKPTTGWQKAPEPAPKRYPGVQPGACSPIFANDSEYLRQYLHEAALGKSADCKIPYKLALKIATAEWRNEEQARDRDLLKSKSAPRVLAPAGIVDDRDQALPASPATTRTTCSVG